MIKGKSEASLFGRPWGCFFAAEGYFAAMSKIEEIEQAVEQLPLQDFAQFALWIERRRQQLETPEGSTAGLTNGGPGPGRLVVRDYGSFLNSYAPQDEGLYDDAACG
jgi:hypothetical protein